MVFTFFLPAALCPHDLPIFKLVAMHCRLVLQTGVADCSATMFLTDWHCIVRLLMGVHLRECGVIRYGLFAPATHGLREPVSRAGLHCTKLKRQFALCGESL